MSDRFAWIKKKELGLPLGVWAVILAAVVLFLYRRHKAAAGGTSAASSTNPNGADALGNAPTSGGANDSSGALAGIANEVALETQLLTNVLDRLQGKKKRPHKNKHHPKHHKAPTTHKTPIAHHPKHKHRKIRPRHKRSGVTSGGGGGGRPSVLSAIRAQAHTSTTMNVRPGGIFKIPHGSRFPREFHLGEPMAHPRSELHPGTEHLPETPHRSFTRGPATEAKPNPLPTQVQHREVAHHHPAFTKPRKH